MFISSRALFLLKKNEKETAQTKRKSKSEKQKKR
jgi:hypothetical protein